MARRHALRTLVSRGSVAAMGIRGLSAAGDCLASQAGFSV